MQIVVATVISMLGKPYLYGGKTLSGPGVDCSFLVETALLSAGINEVKGQNAQGIYNALVARTGTAIQVIKTGSVVFYGTDLKHIDHVAFALDSRRVIESGGGDASFTSVIPEQQAAHHAGVRVRLLDHRPDRVAVLYPSYSQIGLY